MSVNKIEMAESLVKLLVPALKVISNGGPTASKLAKAEGTRDQVMIVASHYDIVDLVLSEARAKLAK